MLSEGGKPILSNIEDYSNVIIRCGLMQAMAGVSEDAGESIKYIDAGSTKIVFLFRRNLTFVVVSRMGEPEAALERMLCFMYSQLIFVLTSKIHSVLDNNPSKDIRNLIGDDTIALMSRRFDQDITPSTIALDAIEAFVLEKNIRAAVVTQLTNAVLESKSIAGLLLYKRQLMGYYLDETNGVTISTNDLHLLASFVCDSKALRYHDENWVPICLPDFNPDAFLQAYISHFSHNEAKSDVALVLLSADHESFTEIHRVRAELETTLPISELLAPRELDKGVFVKDLTYPPMQFMLKVRSEYNPYLPAQLLTATLEPMPEATHDRVLVQQLRHAICMRVGAATPEASLLRPIPLEAQNPGVVARARAGGGLRSPDRVLPESNMPDYDGSGESLSMLPIPDHALSFTALPDNGPLVIAVASAHSELHATFSPSLSAEDACKGARDLSEQLRKMYSTYFQR